jgi:arylamine N-acetyltransferase
MINTWQQKYLEYLGFRHSIATPITPDLEQLSRLTCYHLQRVPYELISKFHYFSNHSTTGWFVPPVDVFVNNLVNKGWGGNCFTLNFCFGQLLTSIGFDVKYVRVSPGHVGLMVTFQDCTYYTDVGYGAPLFKPILLQQQVRLLECGEEIVITQKSNHVYEIDRRSNGSSFTKKDIEYVPLTIEDFHQDVASSHRDLEDNSFMRKITAVIYRDGCRWYLKNETLTKNNVREEDHIFREKAEWLATVSEVFGIEKGSLDDTLSFLKDRNIRIFS